MNRLGLPLIFFLFIPLALPRSVWAEGGISHGGGKGLQCTEADGKTRIYLADTFYFVRSGKADLLQPVDPTAVVPAAAIAVDELFPDRKIPHPFREGQSVSLGWMIQYTADGLSTEYEDTLKNSNDDHIDLRDYPENCRTKVQLAVQDLPWGRVHLDFKLVHQLSWFEQGFLNLHETLIALRNLPGADTTPIREDVLKIAEALDIDRPGGHTGADSRLHSRILEILSPKKGPSLYPPTNPELQRCESVVYKASFRGAATPPSADLIHCRKLVAASRAESARADAKAALPTLWRVPAKLKCLVQSVGQQEVKIKVQPSFTLIRTAGDGRPRSENVFTLNGLLGATSPMVSERSFFDTNRHHRDGAFRPHGDLRIQIEFEKQRRRDPQLQLFVDHYNEVTRTFTGHLIFSKPKTFGRGEASFSYFGIGCMAAAEAPRFAIDLEQSSY